MTFLTLMKSLTHWELCRQNKEAGLEGDKRELEIARDQAQ